MYSAVLVVPETFDNRGKYVVSFSFFFFFCNLFRKPDCYFVFFRKSSCFRNYGQYVCLRKCQRTYKISHAHSPSLAYLIAKLLIYSCISNIALNSGDHDS